MPTEPKTIDGVTFVNTHNGQKRAYGDSFYEYEVTSDRPPEEVERVCAERILRALSAQQYVDEFRANPTMENHFRAHYTFTRVGPGRYFYSVRDPFAD